MPPGVLSCAYPCVHSRDIIDRIECIVIIIVAVPSITILRMKNRTKRQTSANSAKSEGKAEDSSWEPTEGLREWLCENYLKPHPTRAEKEQLARENAPWRVCPWAMASVSPMC